MILPILPSISMKFWPNQYISFKVVCVEGLIIVVFWKAKSINCPIFSLDGVGWWQTGLVCATPRGLLS